MSKTANGAMSLVTHRIQGFRKQKLALPEGLDEQHRALAHEVGGPNTKALADFLHADRLVDERRYSEALIAYQEALARNPGSLRLLRDYEQFIQVVATRVSELGRIHPEAHEFGRAYELLMELGYVGLQMHQSAIHHYRLIGKPEQAREVAARLKKRAPHHPGANES